MHITRSLLTAAAFGLISQVAFAAGSETPAPVPIKPPVDAPFPGDPSGPSIPGGEGDSVKPTACSTYTPDAKSKAVGQWSLRQRDDGQDWSGPWDIEFKPDGVWTQGGENAGYWCQKDSMIFFGFSQDPHTTYRGKVSSKSIKGIESWNGGGTGIFEVKKLK